MPAMTGLSGQRSTYRAPNAKVAARRQAVGLGGNQADISAIAAAREAARTAAGAPPSGQVRQGAPIQRGPRQGAGSQPALGQAGGLGQNFQAGVGSQLSSRVSSGAITQAQAEQTASQRKVLEETYGPEWRAKVYGDTGYVKRTRRAMTNNPESKRAQALYANLMKLRAEALEKAGA